MRSAKKAEPQSSQAVSSGLDHLQGTWIFVSGRRELELVIRGDTFAALFSRGEAYLGSVEVSAGGQTKRMEMFIRDGPFRHRGLTTRCIYELDGDRLKWCAGRPGGEEAIECFPADDDPRFLTIVFQRAKE